MSEKGCCIIASRVQDDVVIIGRCFAEGYFEPSVTSKVMIRRYLMGRFLRPSEAKGARDQVPGILGIDAIIIHTQKGDVESPRSRPVRLIPSALALPRSFE